MIRKSLAALVLQPVNPMRRLQIGTIKGIAAGEQQIEITILVEIDRLDAAQSKCWIGRLPNQLLYKIPFALIAKQYQPLMFLANQSDEIRFPIAIEISHRHVTRPMQI